MTNPIITPRGYFVNQNSPKPLLITDSQWGGRSHPPFFLILKGYLLVSKPTQCATAPAVGYSLVGKRKVILLLRLQA